ncbi:uncharacterized protein LOC132715510 [Ruditapes philippinarum]|uniref:uncharacterized protein LOC132715510 n=1 Tax=Ruditapes philippinarum TaxID=129788 RepID=UPI00295B2381|nr:uncharacterized protein LOC132715510 [Ruditapes philippinarum]
MAFANGAYIILLTSLVLSTTDGSVKKGYGIDLMAFKCGDLDALANISWWYNWDANLKQIEEKSGCKIDEKYVPLFVPIIWGYNPSWSPDRYSVDDRYDIVLGFNEPNHKSQSNLTAQEAADAWYIVEQEADNKKIASPAAARCGSGCHIFAGTQTDHLVEWVI